MPPVPGIPLLVQLLFKGVWLTGENTVNSMHFESLAPGPYTVADLENLASASFSYWNTNMLTVQSQDWGITEVVAIDRSVSDGNQGVYQSSAEVGDLTDPPLALNTAVLGQWQDSVHYRGGHARDYFPGAVNTQTTDGKSLTTAAHTAWQNAWAAFRANYSGTAWGMISFRDWRAAHYTRNHLPLLTPYSSTLTPLGISTVLATQRRRLRKAAHS